MVWQRRMGYDGGNCSTMYREELVIYGSERVQAFPEKMMRVQRSSIIDYHCTNSGQARVSDVARNLPDGIIA